jgi:transposase
VTRHEDGQSRRNRYVARAHVTEHQFREIVRLFALDVEATKVAALTGISRRTINRYFRLLRVRMAQASESHAAPGVPASGPSPSGAVQRVPGFAIVARYGRIYTWILSEEDWARMTSPGSDTPPAGPGAPPAVDAIVDLRSGLLTRLLEDGERPPDERVTRIDRIESFWRATQARLARRRGLRPKYVYLHLKESEFRFNHKGNDLYRTLLALVRRNPVA